MLLSEDVMSQIETSCKAQIYLCDQNRGTKAVVVTKNSKVGILDKVYQRSNFYIMNGKLLQKTMRFEFYDIKNDDIIYVTSDIKDIDCTDRINGIIQSQREQIIDSNTMFSLRKISDNSFRKEYLRLKDLNMLRCEGKKLKMMPKVEEKKTDSIVFIIPEKKISNEKLPKFW